MLLCLEELSKRGLLRFLTQAIQYLLQLTHRHVSYEQRNFICFCLQISMKVICCVIRY